jgi:MOSC domain-containing protein YiiM
MAIVLLGVRIGRPEPFGPQGEPSAIAKQAISGRVRVTRLGLAGDGQADTKHHGGPDKAIHLYPHEHYARWRTDLPERSAPLAAGGFGENLSTHGLTEAEACLGDLYRLGSAVIRISQGRKPCWKLNTRFGIEDMARRVHETGRTGWYFRVIEEGEAGPGDNLTLLERPYPDWTVARLFAVLQQQVAPAPGDLAFLAQADLLAAGWREQAAKRLAALSL